MQEGKPLAFYSRKLSDMQKRYTTGEQELLSIVETLKEFRNILLGQKLIVHMDHKNILYDNLANDRIVRWRLLLEEYGPEYLHVAGKDNIMADALSRMDATFSDEENDGSVLKNIPQEQDDDAHGVMCSHIMAELTCDESLFEDETELQEDLMCSTRMLTHSQSTFRSVPFYWPKNRSETRTCNDWHVAATAVTVQQLL